MEPAAGAGGAFGNDAAPAEGPKTLTERTTATETTTNIETTIAV